MPLMKNIFRKTIATAALALLSTQALANEGAFDVNAPVGLALIGLLLIAVRPRKK